MELKSYLHTIDFPENTEYNFSLKSHVGQGSLNLTYIKLSPFEYLVHIRLEAVVAAVKKFRFEGLSKWEKEADRFVFSSYEEKDFTKKIHKKYEIISEGLNYIENKKGLILEREVQYFTRPEELDRIFDPMSAVALFPLEFQDKENKKLFIFGKQRIIEIEIEKNGQEIKVVNPSGTNEVWAGALKNLTIKTGRNNIIEALDVPAPLGLGTIKMRLEKTQPINQETIQKKIKSFTEDFE